MKVPNKKSKSNLNQSPKIVGGRLVRRHHDFFAYAIFGFLASLVNIAVFFIFKNILHLNLIVANTIAFFISNLFSFIMNKHVVFTTESSDERGILIQIGLFFMYRILSIIPDNIVMIVGLNWLMWNSLFVKIIDQLIVGIFNYYTTRSVFRKETNYLRKKIQANKQASKKEN